MSDIDPISDEENFFDNFNEQQPNFYQQALFDKTKQTVEFESAKYASHKYQSDDKIQTIEENDENSYFEDELFDDISLGLEQTFMQ